MSLDALGGPGRARVIASKIRDLQIHKLEVSVMREINRQDADDVVPGLQVDDGKPVTYGQELRRVDDAIEALVALCPEDQAELEAACKLLAEQPAC